MASQEFIPGDVVRLKSGGPDMTVSKTGDGAAECQWFGPDGSGLHKQVLLFIVLEKAVAEKKSKRISSYAG